MIMTGAAGLPSALEAEADSYVRADDQYPRYAEFTTLKSFPFTHTAPFLDLHAKSRTRIIQSLRHARTTLESAAVHDVRNDYLHYRASTVDLWGSVVKCTLFGAIIAIVCCYKGMTASGGAEGVGRAVNQAVVIAFLGVFAFNYVFTQTLLATHPEITVIK